MPKYKRLSEVQKTKIICFSEQHQSNRQIADQVGCNESSVRRFLKSYKETGRTEGRKYMGRPRILTTREEARLKRLSVKDRFQSASKLKKELFQNTRKTCSTKTIERRLKDMGLQSCRPAKKPLLTKAMRQKRLQWCKKYKNWDYSHWEKVVFSDESKINLIGADGGVRVRRRKGERYHKECVTSTVRHSPYVMVWGAMTSKGVGELILLEGSVNAVAYKKIIDDGVVPTIEDISQHFPDVTFQDDSAPCHRAQSVTKYKEELGLSSLDWPGNSPDLNPIENVWSVLKRKIRAKEPRTILDLKNVITRVWFDEIDNAYLKALYDSMPGRLHDVIKARGSHINK